jgi:aminoglycoside phosphotransferase (APT) family kinase protein
VKSLTKRPVTEDELVSVVAHAFGHEAEIADWHELTGGTYNAAYRVLLCDGRDLVLKVAPPPGLKLLTHEVDLMRTEVDFYMRAAAGGVPVPRVWYADFERRVIGSDYVFLHRFTGTSLYELREAPVRRELGRIAATLSIVTGPSYGYPLRGSRSWQPTWRGAFLAMVDDILDDGRRLGAELPAAPDRIGALVYRHAEVLEAVRRPVLVHFDLWDGNVFVASAGDACRVEGIIDGERAFFGDPLAELVSLALLRDVDDEPEMLAGYGEVAPLDLTEDARLRIDLYTVYLYLIMVTEGATRGYDTPEHHAFRRHLLDLLDARLSRL